MADKILDKILSLVKRLESDWEEDLVNLNIWDNVCDLYYLFNADHRKANIILAYIVLSYSKHSPRLDMNMDRMDNKISILTSLGGISAMADKDYCNAAVGNLSPYTEIIEFYINFQKDRRFQEIVAAYDYHAKATFMMTTAMDSKEMESAGRVFNIACSLREKADSMRSDIEKENVHIDSALEKEDREKLSDRMGKDFMSHEVYMRSQQQSDDSADFSGNIGIMDKYEDGPL